MDYALATDEFAPLSDRVLAGASLTANLFTFGLAPNFAAAKRLAKVGRAAEHVAHQERSLDKGFKALQGLKRSAAECSVRSANPTPSHGLGNIGSHGPIDPSAVLHASEKWLGQGNREIAPGIFRSADGMRQFRMTSRDLLPTHGDIGAHVHFEALNELGAVVENLHLPVRQ